MRSREWKWGLLIIVIVLAGYLLPYTLLSDNQTWTGSFLLWSVLALLIIVVNFVLTRNWGE